MKRVIFLIVFIGSLVQWIDNVSLANHKKVTKGVIWPKEKTLFGPGFGWDYLTSVVSGFPLINISFYNGQTTNDMKYLVPDCFVVEDKKLTDFSTSSEIIESSMQSSDITSKSMSAGFSASTSTGFGKVSVSGSYSSDHQDMMAEQTKSKTVTVRSKFYSNRYTLMINSDCQLNGGFEKFVLEIANLLEANETDWAEYLAEELVRDYGTHYIKKVSIGGIFYIDDYLSTSYFFNEQNSYSKTKIKAQAKFKNAFFKTSANYEQEESSNSSSSQEFSNNITSTRAQAIGGMFEPQYKVDDWVRTLDDNLAIIDKEADLINSFVTYYNFPNIPRIYLAKTRKLVTDAIKAYLEYNLIDGCQDRKSVRYQPFSTYHDPELCKEEYIFGGFYEKLSKCTISCGQLATSYLNNFLTKQPSCLDGYTPVAHTFNSSDSFYTFYECIGEVGFEKSPILFGGIFTNGFENNPVTDGRFCPPSFTEYPILQEKATICISRDWDKGIVHAIPFVGFISTCDIKEIKNLKCSRSIYEKRFIASINGCYIYYCSRIKVTEKGRLQKPPYLNMPQKNYIDNWSSRELE